MSSQYDLPDVTAIKIMTVDQTIMFAIFALAMIFFVWGRIRYDVVALSALVVAVVLGMVPSSEAFTGFSQGAVVTVVLVLIISAAIKDSGVIDRLANPLERVSDRPLLFMAMLTGIAALLSGFMNNVGALALLMPVAISLSKRPSLVLMPLSFGTILGGLATLIGTPPNIIVSNYRQQITGEAFGLFDFSPVGGIVAISGLLFLLLIGWRLIPSDRNPPRGETADFEIKDYVTEIIVPDDHPLINEQIFQLESLSDGGIQVVGIIRGSTKLFGNVRLRHIRQGDILMVQAGPNVLQAFLDAQKLELAGADEFIEEHMDSEHAAVMEAVVLSGSRIEGRSPRSLYLRRKYGANLLGIAREGRPIQDRIGRVRLRAGDVLLLQGEPTTLPDTMNELGAVPLAQRALLLGQTQREDWLPFALFALAIAATALFGVPVVTAFATAVVTMLLTGRIDPQKLYQSIDWPIVVLLGAMIPLGNALEQTGATALVANSVVSTARSFGPLVLLALIMIVTMTLSDIMNNTATAVIMAPIAATVASEIGSSQDAFLMAVALGASCAFLTPIGHQNNLLVMGPGGYRFGDYWRLGLPLQTLIVIIGTPLIAFIWQI